MTEEQINNIQNLAFALADETVMVIPVIGPIVAAVEAIIKTARANGVVPTQISSGQAAAMSAWIAAHDASLITSFQTHHKDSK